MLSQQALAKGLQIEIKALTPRAEQALDKVLRAHPMLLKKETGWNMQVNKRESHNQIVVTTAKPAEVDKIRGLGYIGL